MARPISSNWPFQAPTNEVTSLDDERRSNQRLDQDSLYSKGSSSVVIGTTELYEDGKIRLIPMPSPDPKDPLNLPRWRKWTAIGAICFFGALALSAEIVIGALIPVFLLEYSGVDPKILNAADFQKISGGNAEGVNPFAVLPPGVIPAPIEKIAMLSTIPLLTNGVASYFLVPLSIGIGRRPVLLVAAAAAWAGGLWAGTSTSLNQHLAARAVQGLGAGAVEALIPLIIQDMVFIHQRNKAMSAIVSSQGIIITALGIAAPYIASNYTWRWLYFITSGVGILAWVLLIAFLPETRWTRSKEELTGQKVYPLQPGENRPALDYVNHSEPTIWTYVGCFQFGYEWKAAGMSMLHTIRTTYFPAMIWATLGNTAFFVVNSATQQITSFALLAQGWQFQYTGLSVLPFIAATALVYVFGGPVADRVANAAARRNGGGREPEHHLLNTIMPFVVGIAGCFLFGWAGQNNVHWAALLSGTFLIIFSFLTLLSVVNVYMVESYPMWAGPVLVNVSSLRIIISFFISSEATTWIAEKGFLNTFAIYAEALIVASLGIPLLYFYGKPLRRWTAGKIGGRTVEEVEDLKSKDEFQ